MELTDKEQFVDKTRQFLEAAKDNEQTDNFAHYFECEYVARPELWAYCYHVGLKVHHNMHFEAMHRVIKHAHLQGQKVRRLDKSIHALMKFMRTKLSDRLIKVHEGKWTRHLGGIRRQHETIMHLSSDRCICIAENLQYSVIGRYAFPDGLPVTACCELACR